MRRVLVAVLASAVTALGVTLAVVLPAGAAPSMPASAVGVSSHITATQNPTSAAADPGGGVPSGVNPNGLTIADSRVPVNARGVSSVIAAKQLPLTGAVAQMARRMHHRAHAAGSGCWNWSLNYWLFNSLGYTLADYYLPAVYWCGNGSWITYHAPVSPEGFVYYLAWQYNGEMSYANYFGGWSPSWWEHTTQGHFCYNVPLVGCLQNWYPGYQIQAFANGGLWVAGRGWLAYG